MIEQHTDSKGKKTFEVESESGKKDFGSYSSKKAALKRLAEVEFFKHKDANAGSVKKVEAK